MLFEGGLLVLYLPMVAWYLNISLWHALPTRSSMMRSTPFCGDFTHCCCLGSEVATRVKSALINIAYCPKTAYFPKKANG
ncbi:chlorhexidine efflux transporter [Psychrobacter celer]|uniref:chlorhexidine efflux transporter n=1 Tax=Psychrobacter celer TaxID=306572 RepID=UPI003FD562D5